MEPGAVSSGCFLREEQTPKGKSRFRNVMARFRFEGGHPDVLATARLNPAVNFAESLPAVFTPHLDP